MSFRGPGEVFAWAESFTNLERNLPALDKRVWRLDRMRRLLEAAGGPDTRFRSFHVAGSKGKGSTAALMAGVLTASGRKTGLYTSPHVSSPLERISVDGQPPDPVLFTLMADRARALVDGLADSLPGGFSPTTFELLTLLAFLAFREAGCDDAVVETGIGGRLDATNVIMPEASVLTPLDLEHTDILGDTIEEIAAEKAGIIKEGVPAFAAGRPPESKEVFRRAAALRGAPLAFLDEEADILSVAPGTTATGFTLRLRGGEPVSFTLSMPGAFQAENAALAYLCLRRCRPRIAETQFRAGFAATRLPGRMEIVPGSPTVVLDGAHTPLAVRRLLETFQVLYPAGGVLLFGSVSGKRPHEMAEVLAPAFERIVISRPNAFKPSDPREVWAIFRQMHKGVELLEDPVRALARARELAAGRPILVTGSFYMVSEIRALLVKEP
ncbi:MAG: Mur ligase family protein [Spirochaetes bacterium]|nr:Mur ligase family protein [Spirochaetota bacterium]